MRLIFTSVLMHLILFVTCQQVDTNIIFINKCISCHQQNSNAPFSFNTINDIVQIKKTVLYTIEQNIMPPWVPDASYSHFKNERYLSNTEKNMLVNWIKQLNPSDKNIYEQTKTRTIKNNNKYVFTNQNTFILNINQKDTIINFEIPYSLQEAMDINQIEFFCNDLSLIHHVNYFVIDSSKITESIKDGMKGLSNLNLLGANIILGYAPGNKQRAFADSFGFTFPKSGVIRGDLHISQVIKKINFSFGFTIYKSATPITYKMHLLTTLDAPQTKINYEALELLPNEIKTFKYYTETKKDIHLVYTHPHMHVYGKSMNAYAITPSNDTIPIIKINDWKFYQQEFYEFVQPIFLPKGSKIYLEATYDNTNNNLLNPFNPPHKVMEGTTTFEEMMLNLLLYY